MDDLGTVKAELVESLGEEFKRYLSLLKSWFRGVIDKDGFDFEAEKMLDPVQFKLHNRFIVCLFMKCHTLSGCRSEGIPGSREANASNSGSKGKKAKVSSFGSGRSFDRTSSPSEFLIPVPLISSSDFPPSIINNSIKKHVPSNGTNNNNNNNNNLIKLTFCTSEGGLPNNVAATLRIFVNVWESGLNGMDDETVKLINLSIRDFVKNILTAVLSFRSSCKMTSDGFRFNFGVPSSMDPLKLNTYQTSAGRSFTPTDSSGNRSSANMLNYSSDPLTSSIIQHPDVLEQDALHQVASSSSSSLSHGGNLRSLSHGGNLRRSFKQYQKDECCDEEYCEDLRRREECWNEGRSEESINLWHLFHALKTYRNCITSNSIYSTNMTRIITRLNHRNHN